MPITHLSILVKLHFDLVYQIDPIILEYKTQLISGHPGDTASTGVTRLASWVYSQQHMVDPIQARNLSGAHG